MSFKRSGPAAHVWSVVPGWIPTLSSRAQREQKALPKCTPLQNLGSTVFLCRLGQNGKAPASL